MSKFTGHEKRVTLTLAKLSVAASQVPGLTPVLNKLPAVDFDLYALPQADVEMIYASFDERLEASVKAEYSVDPEFLVDLKEAIGVCPLCGQEQIRWLFNIQNTAGGESINCGSACIISHGLNVKGASTAAHARRVLEQAIRRKIRKNLLDQWHTETTFKSEMFDVAREILSGINLQVNLNHSERYQARVHLAQLAVLERFYVRHGWIGTKAKWAKWEAIVAFTKAVKHLSEFKLPVLTNWVKPKAEKKPKSTPSASAPVEAAGESAPQAMSFI